jgi:threonine efflux protein
VVEALILLFAAHLLAVASPGPSTAAIMATAMNQGRRSALTLALGVTAGSATWGFLAAAGVSAIIVASPTALYLVKIAGGIYLLYLAVRSARSAMQKHDVVGISPPATSAVRTFVRGYLMHITNPKAILGWMSIISIGLPTTAPIELVPVILGGCFLISLFCNCTYGLIFSTAPVVAAYRRLRRPLEAALAGLFGYAGARLLTSN